MADSKFLAQFKRNGNYTVFVDDSELPTIPEDQPLYCIVIQSRFKDAPVNTLVQINDTIELETVFGKRDKAQERKGNFSMLCAELLLSRGEAIYVLNVRDYDSAKKTTVAAMSTDNLVDNLPTELVQYKSLFDTTTFWKLDRETFIAAGTNQALHFCAIRSSNLTIYVRRAASLPAQFDTYVSEHKVRFPKNEITYVPDSLKIADTFVEVFVFDKDLTNNVATTNPALAAYLDNTGAVKKIEGVDTLVALSGLTESGFKGVYTGSLVKEIFSIDGESFYIENIINANAKTTGLAVIVDDNVVQANIDWDYENGPIPLTVAVNAQNLTLVTGEVTSPATKAVSYELPLADNTNQIEADIFASVATIYAQSSDEANYQNLSTAAQFDGTYEEDNAFIEMNIAPVIVAGEIQKNQFYSFGDIIKLNANLHKLVAADVTTADITSVQYLGRHRTNPVIQSTDLVVDPGTNLAFPQDNAGNFLYPATWPNDAGAIVVYALGIAQDKLIGGANIPQPTLSGSQLEAFNVAYGKYTPVYLVKSNKNLFGLSTHTFVGSASTFNVYDFTNTIVTYDVQNEPVAVLALRTFETRATIYTPTLLKGVPLDDSQFCDGTATRQAEILDLLETDTFKNGMLDVKKYQFKIIVDGFKTYIEQNAKKQIAKLAKDSKHYNYLASMPFMSDFKKSTNPYFKSTPDSPLDANYIVSGGNKDLPYNKLWSMVTGEENGDYATGYFSSEEIYSDGITSVVVPGGPIKALNYGLNFTNNARAPYDAVGGEKYGLIEVEGIIGLQHEFSNQERDILEPAGYNLSIYNSDGQIMIFNSASAKQSPKTLLSSLENGFLMSYVAAEIDPIIESAIFDPRRNTQPLRDEKRLETAKKLDRLVTAGAITRYDVICDETNNDVDTRDLGYFILDTVLYGTSGIKIGVHRSTIRRDV